MVRWEGADSILIDVCAACVWEHKSTCFAPSTNDGAPMILYRPKCEEPLPDVLHARVCKTIRTKALHARVCETIRTNGASLSPTNE